MNDRVFLDTNVLLYLFDYSDINKQKTVVKLVEKALKQKSGCISSQVMQEFLNILIKKHPETISEAEIQRLLNDLLVPLCEHYPDSEFYSRVLPIRSRYGIGFYDAMIATAAIDLGCAVLYSEDLQDGQVYGTVQVINPFR